jgi:hypothetical protein
VNEFTSHWSRLDSYERRNLRAQLEETAIQNMSLGMKLRSTNNQIKAAARKLADRAIAQARTGPQTDDL